MSTTFSVWSVVVLGILFANAPFFTDRWWGVFRLSSSKSLPLRLLELLSFYLMLGLLALLLEKNAGQITPQGWEFFAITFFVFLTFSFPGFVYCYLLQRK